jgi:hypothetical protein
LVLCSHLGDLNADAKTHLFDVISKGLTQTILSINQLFGRDNSKKKNKRGASQSGDDAMDTEDGRGMLEIHYGRYLRVFKEWQLTL